MRDGEGRIFHSNLHSEQGPQSLWSQTAGAYDGAHGFTYVVCRTNSSCWPV